MDRIALFPGSFDPFTLGHEDIVRRSLPLFDKIIVAIGYNAQKQTSFFSLEQRMSWIEGLFMDEPRVEVVSYQGLTIDVCKRTGAQFILRGIRSSTDYEYEKAIAQANRQMAQVETVLVFTAPEYSAITSTIVRDVHRHGGNPQIFLPAQIQLPKQ